MTTPEEAKSEVEAAFDEYWERTGGGVCGKFACAQGFYAGVKFVTDLNQEKIAQLIKEVD